jgi:hypothetical protein
MNAVDTALHSGVAAAYPIGSELKFKLRRLRMLQQLQAGELLEAQQTLQRELGALAAEDKSVDWMLQVRGIPARMDCTLSSYDVRERCTGSDYLGDAGDS